MNDNQLQINLYPLSGKCSEADAAKLLSEMISKTIPSAAKGTIDILSGVNIPFGRVSDIDILLVADLHDCHLIIDDNEIDVRSFCTAIELKEQTVDDVYATSTNIYVNYPSTNERKNASEQNRNQKYTILNYCKHRDYSIFISNILWLKSVSLDIWESKGWNTTSPVLLSSFCFGDIIKQIIKSGQSLFHGKLDALMKRKEEEHKEDLSLLVNDFIQERPVAPATLRVKTEHLVSGLLENDAKAIINNNDFNCIDGKAGTGKTFLLLQTALKRAADGYSCALLTYNNALTMDLQRLVSFIPSSPDARSNLTISTLHSYLYSLASYLGWKKSNQSNKIIEYIHCLYEQNNKKPLRTKYADDIDDFIFLDEAQDCTPDEKDFLECVYGKERIIVAKSALQKIRRNTAARWGVPNIKLKQGLRQKANIVSFLKSLTEEMGISDTCAGFEPAQGLEGGKVIIAPHYTTDLHTMLEQTCKDAKCSNYDILVLVSPAQVKDNHFIKADLWKNTGKINFIDGTNTKALASCSPKELIDSCRIFQYESCRGLEGWVTVCYNIDEIMELKYNEVSVEEDVIGDVCRLKWEQVFQWIMMPLTRAIDTLVITLADTSSDIASMLRRAALKHQDFTDCKI